MNIQEQLARAIVIATNIHAGQFDKGGKPYILHPIRLMMQLMFDTQLATIAILHDAIEDSKGALTIEDLEEMGFSPRVLSALRLLTHDPKDDYLGVYIVAICGNWDAVRVKRKDLDDNSRITRLKGIRPKDHDRIEKYHKAYLMLTGAKREFERR